VTADITLTIPDRGAGQLVPRSFVGFKTQFVKT